MGGYLKMIGYENNTSHPAYRREMDSLDRENAIASRAEEIAKDIESKPYESDDLYCGVERAEEKYRVEITVLINNGAYLKAAEKIAELMDAARARRAEWQAEELAYKEFE